MHHNTVPPSAGDYVDSNDVPNDVNNDVKLAFVYGSLREGGTNRHVATADGLLASSHRATLQGKFAMFHYDARGRGSRGTHPYLLEQKQESSSDTIIVGEVLEFSDWERALRNLDALEQCPGWYYRKVVNAQVEGRGEVDAWVYFMQPKYDVRHRGAKVTNGDWIEDYQNGPKP